MEKTQLFCIKHKTLATFIGCLVFIIPFTVIYKTLGIPFAAYLIACIIFALAAILTVSTAATALTLPAVQKLNDECDPYPLMAVSEKIIARTKSTVESLNAKLNFCVAVSNLGQYEKNLELLRSITIEAFPGILPQTKFVYYNNLSSAYVSLGDAETARIWFEKSGEVLSAIKNKTAAAVYNDTHRFNESELLLLEGRAEEALAILKTVENNCRARSVYLALSTAKAHIMLGDTISAKTALDYVIATGNKLYAVTEAKELLARIEQKI